VDLAIKGQLAPTEDDHHQHIHLVVAVGLDAIAVVEPDQVGLQLLPIQPPPRTGMATGRSEAGQVDRRDGVRYAAIFLSHPSPPEREEGPGNPLGSGPGSTRRPGTARLQTRPGRYRSTWRDCCCGGHGTASPAVPAPRPGPCPGCGPAVVAATRPNPTPPGGRVKGAWRPCGTAGGRPLTLARAARAGVHAAPGGGRSQAGRPRAPVPGDSAGMCVQ